MNRFSPLRYPGGKGKLAPYLAEIIALNNLGGGHYAEPFAGGAAVALDLLFSERVRHIHINDLDPCVFAFWHSVVHETDAMITRIREEATLGIRSGIIKAVHSTGGVITSAGIIFAASMFGLLFGSITTMLQTGFIIGAGLLIDTFVVRTITVPALAAMVGRANWWPSKAH